MRVYVSSKPFEQLYCDQGARILPGARIRLESEGSARLSHSFSGEFKILQKNDALIDAVASADVAYVALVARVSDEQGNRLPGT